MLRLPAQPSNIERVLAQVYLEQQTGLTTATITLAKSVAQTQDGVSLLLLFKNGALLKNAAGAGNFTVTGNTITLGTAAIAGDQFVIYYHYRT